MKTVWKYFLLRGRLLMPQGAKILSVQMQAETLVLWAEVDTELPTERRVFRVISTGYVLPGENPVYIGTFQDGPFVGHVYECFPDRED